MKKLLNISIRILSITLILVSLSLLSNNIYQQNFSREAIDQQIQDLYADLWRQTGQSQEKIPLRIVDSDEINAYNDGYQIVLYRGLLKTMKTWDELALVLGHEIAHGNLWHLRMLNEWKVGNTSLEISVLEGNADKLGALYMEKAGYSICRGREWFKTMLIRNGDYQGGNHPGYAYRYNQLNVNCD